MTKNTMRNFEISRLYGVNVNFEWKSTDGQKGRISYALNSDVQKFYLMDEGYTRQESSALLQALFEKLKEICIVKETPKKSQRDEIVASMCYSVRHDFGLNKEGSSPLSGGMTDAERKALWTQMQQIYDNVIVPNFLNNEYR